MITQQDLIAAGFKKFNQKNLWQFTETGWQKCIRDKEGNKKYFITIAEYDNSNFPDILKNSGKYSFQPEGQFETEDGITFNIEMLHPKSVGEVLDFFEKIYYRMNCLQCDKV